EPIDYRLGQPAARGVHETAKISLAHSVRGEQAVLIEAIAAIVRFKSREPESLVLPVVDLGDVDRTAGGERELVVLQRRVGTVVGGTGPGRGGELRVTVVPEGRAIELIGAALRRRADHAAAGGGVFGGEGSGLNGELLDRFGRE